MIAPHLFSVPHNLEYGLKDTPNSSFSNVVYQTCLKLLLFTNLCSEIAYNFHYYTLLV